MTADTVKNLTCLSKSDHESTDRQRQGGGATGRARYKRSPRPDGQEAAFDLLATPKRRTHAEVRHAISISRDDVIPEPHAPDLNAELHNALGQINAWFLPHGRTGRPSRHRDVELDGHAAGCIVLYERLTERKFDIELRELLDPRRPDEPARRPIPDPRGEAISFLMDNGGLLVRHQNQFAFALDWRMPNGRTPTSAPVQDGTLTRDQGELRVDAGRTRWVHHRHALSQGGMVPIDRQLGHATAPLRRHSLRDLARQQQHKTENRRRLPHGRQPPRSRFSPAIKTWPACALRRRTRSTGRGL